MTEMGRQEGKQEGDHERDQRKGQETDQPRADEKVADQIVLAALDEKRMVDSSATFHAGSSLL